MSIRCLLGFHDFGITHRETVDESDDLTVVTVTRVCRRCFRAETGSRHEYYGEYAYNGSPMKIDKELTARLREYVATRKENDYRALVESPENQRSPQ